MIIDCRCRPPTKEFVKVHKGALFQDVHSRLSKFPVPRALAEESMDMFWQEMDEAGVEKAVVQARYMPSAGTVTNDVVAELVRKYPDEIIGIAAVDVNIPLGEAEKEIQRAVGKLGLKGLSLEPTAAGSPMGFDDHRLNGLYGKCEALGIPVFLTTGPIIGRTLTDTAPSHIEQVVMQFPKLRLVLAHGCYPYVLETIAFAVRYKTVYLSPDLYTFLPGGNMYLEAANTVLKDQFVFGSAYPFVPLKESVDLVKGFPFAAGILDKVLYKTAQTLLGA